MFKCTRCNEITKAGESQNKVITERRPQKYESWIKRGKKKIMIKSEGWEIAKEVVVCKGCLQEGEAS